MELNQYPDPASSEEEDLYFSCEESPVSSSQASRQSYSQLHSLSKPRDTEPGGDGCQKNVSRDAAQSQFGNPSFQTPVFKQSQHGASDDGSPPGRHSGLVELYFENENKSGGGVVREVQLDEEKNQAIVYFEDWKGETKIECTPFAWSFCLLCSQDTILLTTVMSLSAPNDIRC